MAGFWDAVSAPQAVAALKLTVISSLIVIAINAVFGTIIAWVLVRDEFPGKKAVNAAKRGVTISVEEAILLSDRIDLLKDTNVVNVTADDVYISVTIEEKQALIGTSRLMLMVGVKDGQLKQWTVTDPQGYDTTVAVYNLDSRVQPDPNLFRIDYTRVLQ